MKIEPKEEKSSKPLVCQNHFSNKDIDSAGVLKARAVPKVTLNIRNKVRKKHQKKVKAHKKSKKVEIKIKEEPYDEISFEEEKFGEELWKDEPLDKSVINRKVAQNSGEDSTDSEFIKSLLLDVRRMNETQKQFFRTEMMTLLINNSAIN